MNRIEVETLFVLADLGRIRALKNEGDDLGRERLVEIELRDQPPSPVPLHEQVSDQGGRFPGGRDTGEPGGMRLGDVHAKTEEVERRQIEAVAQLIGRLVASQNVDQWRLVAPKAINNRLVAQLPEGLRQKLVLNLHADLVKLPLHDLESRLLNQGERVTI